jgi:hypothetical protein
MLRVLTSDRVSHRASPVLKEVSMRKLFILVSAAALVGGAAWVAAAGTSEA